MPNYNNYPMAAPNQYPMLYNQQPYYQNANQYSNSYSQPQTQPSYQTVYQTAAPIKQFVDWVSGRTAADVYRSEPGSRAYLMDSTGQYFYIKETGWDGRPSPLMAFKYEAVDFGNQNGQSNDAPAADMSNYVTKQDFDELKKMYQDTVEQLKRLNQNNTQNQQNQR